MCGKVSNSNNKAEITYSIGSILALGEVKSYFLSNLCEHFVLYVNVCY